MSSFRERSCMGKIKHRSMTDALTHRRKLAIAKNVPENTMTAYRCSMCGYYHVGHRRGLNRRMYANQKGERRLQMG